MRTTIDAAGRLVVPKAIRDRLGLSAGTQVELTEGDGLLEVAPAPIEVRVADREYGPVLVAEGDGPPLTDDDVRTALERVRR